MPSSFTLKIRAETDRERQVIAYIANQFASALNWDFTQSQSGVASVVQFTPRSYIPQIQHAGGQAGPFRRALEALKLGESHIAKAGTFPDRTALQNAASRVGNALRRRFSVRKLGDTGDFAITRVDETLARSSASGLRARLSAMSPGQQISLDDAEFKPSSVRVLASNLRTPARRYSVRHDRSTGMINVKRNVMLDDFPELYDDEKF